MKGSASAANSFWSLPRVDFTPSRFARSASSLAGPSQPKPKRRLRNTDRSVGPSVLRNLVDLHHTSASFLHNADEITIGFENAFHHNHKPIDFKPYRVYREEVLSRSAERGAGGLSDLAERVNSQSVGKELDKRESLRPAPTYYRTFKKHEDLLWSERTGIGKGRDREEGGMFSERELAVKEALFGTFERGGEGMKRVEPGLDGVMEYIEAKGKTVEEYAEEWEKRNQVD